MSKVGENTDWLEESYAMAEESLAMAA